MWLEFIGERVFVRGGNTASGFLSGVVKTASGFLFGRVFVRIPFLYDNVFSRLTN